MQAPEWTDHGQFAAGMIQDVPRHMLPDGAVWDALDSILTEEGTIAKRGSTVTALSSGTTLSPSVIGYSQLDQDDAPLIRGYVLDESNGAAGNLILGSFTPGSGTFATTTLTGLNQNLVSANGLGRPFNHNGYLVVPFRLPPAASSSLYKPFAAMAGSQSTFQTIASNLTITSGTRTVTGFSASDVATMAVGDIVSFVKNAANDRYYGRVTKISGTTVSVTPTPTRSFTTGTGTSIATSVGRLFDATAGPVSARGAQCGASWQNRVLMGGVGYEITAGVYQWHPNRVVWSILPTETSAANTLGDGDMWLATAGWPASNYLDIPWMDLVRGLEPVSDGEMLVLGRPMCSRLVGTLNTNTTTSGGLTYELRPLNQKIMCVNDKATVRTPDGVMMMGPDGIYLYRDGNLINTMVGRIQSLWLSTYANATIYGAGLLNKNTYYLSTSAGTLVCNLNGYRWTRWQNTDLTNCFTDPQDTTRIFSARYQPGTSSNTTKIVRADYLVNPSSSATTDVSGTGPTMTVTTKAYTEGDASRLMAMRHATVTVRQPGSTGTVTVASVPGLDGEETGATLGTISTATSAQTKRYDITTITRAYGLSFTQSGNPNECELVDIDLSSKKLRQGRLT